MRKLLDLADGSLNSLTKDQMLMAQLTKHLCQHVMYPPFFERANDLPPLVWQKVDFNLSSRAMVPKEKGVYAFALEINHTSMVPVTHILYIGKAGDTDSSNTLWKRYYDYIRTEKVADRVRIAEMLRQWRGKLSYYYAVVGDEFSTGVIEESLLDILIPPYNRGDYSVELSSLLKGANII